MGVGVGWFGLGVGDPTGGGGGVGTLIPPAKACALCGGAVAFGRDVGAGFGVAGAASTRTASFPPAAGRTVTPPPGCTASPATVPQAGSVTGCVPPSPRPTRPAPKTGETR